MKKIFLNISILLFLFLNNAYANAYELCKQNNSGRIDTGIIDTNNSFYHFFNDQGIVCLNNNVLYIEHNTNFNEKEYLNSEEFKLKDISDVFFQSGFNGEKVKISDFKYLGSHKNTETGNFFLGVGEKVFIKGDGAWIKDITPDGFKFYGDNYIGDKNNILYTGNQNVYYLVKGVDVETFKGLGNSWGADKNNLYSGDKKMNVSFDYDTIVSLPYNAYNIAIDKNQGYTSNEKVSKSGVMSHKEMMEAYDLKFEDLNLNFPIKTQYGDYLIYLYVVFGISLLIGLIYFTIKYTKNEKI